MADTKPIPRPDTREIERRVFDRAAKRMQLLLSIGGGLLSAIVGGMAIWLALRDGVSANAIAARQNREAIVRIEGSLQAQTVQAQQLLVQQAEMRADVRGQTQRLQRIESTLERLAQGK